MLTVKTVNISIMNTAVYIVPYIIVNVVHINVVLLALEKNASPVLWVEHMELLTQRTMRSTYVVMRKVVMAISILGATLISLMT
jgi:hypothetical protein